MTLLQILLPNWHHDIFFYLFVITIAIKVILIIRYNKKLSNKNFEIRRIQQEYTININKIRKEELKKALNVQIEMTKREDERNRLWIESEKETLHVLNGVSMLFDLTEKINRVESERILNKIEELKDKIAKT